MSRQYYTLYSDCMLIRYYWPFGNLLLSNSSQTCSTQTDKSLGHFSWIMLEPNLFHHYSQGSRCHVLLDSRHFPLSLSQCPEWLLLLNNLKQTLLKTTIEYGLMDVKTLDRSFAKWLLMSIHEWCTQL